MVIAQTGKVNFLQFKALSEPWNEYKLEDGTILRVRVILSGVLKEDEGKYSLPHTSVFSVMPDPKHLGLPSPPLKAGEQIESYIVADDLKIVEQTNLWNEYEIPSEHVRLSIKGVLVSVSRTSKYDEKGLPIYVTNVQLLVKHSRQKKQIPET